MISFLKHFFFFALLFALSSCATYDPEKGTYKDPENLPNSMSREHAMALLPFAIAHQMSKLRLGSGNGQRPSIWGECQTQKSKPCQNTYISFTDPESGAQNRVWIDTSGEFELFLESGEVRSLQAIGPDGRSKEITVRSPSQVSFTLKR